MNAFPFWRHWIVLMLLAPLSCWVSGQAQWYLPVELGIGPALFSDAPPAGYVLAESQTCAQQVLDFDPFCLENGWDLICQQNYECCMQEDEFLILGCKNPVACNYDEMACVNVPTSCLFCLDACVTMYFTDLAGDGWNGAAWSLSEQESGTVVADGSLANGYTGVQASCVDDGCYVFQVTSGDVPSEVGWHLLGANAGTISGSGSTDMLLSFGDATCDYTPGCTDPAACNYDEDANQDDASCLYPGCPVPGCTNALSSNYDPNATMDDGSCDLSYMCLEGTVYDSALMGCVPATCPGDFDYDGAIDVNDLLEFLLVYNTSCLD